MPVHIIISHPILLNVQQHAYQEKIISKRHKSINLSAEKLKIFVPKQEQNKYF